jgi:DnaJ-class molecular chaperone
MIYDYPRTERKEKIHLNEGEMICDKCEGVGGIPPKIQLVQLQTMCPKCKGSGKVDWIENIVGKVKTKTDIFSSSRYSYTMTATEVQERTTIHDDWIDALAKSISEKIDRQIMESLSNHLEQTNI